MSDALFLVKRGVPYETALRMSPARRLAHVILLGQHDGGEWDWNAMVWRKRDP